MTSSAFDTFLYLLKPDGSVLQIDDDGGGGTNSRIPAGSGFLTLPTTGSYTILANSFDAGATGSYSLTLSEQPKKTLTVTSTPNTGVNVAVFAQLIPMVKTTALPNSRELTTKIQRSP